LIRALLLDAGNTLVFLDTALIADRARRAGHQVRDEACAAAQGPAKRAYEAFLASGGTHDDTGWFVFLEALLAAAGVEASGCADLGKALRREHDDFNLWRRVPDGLPEALDRARAAGIRLGVVSNSEGKIAELLERVGLASRFEVIVDSTIEGVSKPDPEIFRRALSRMGVAAAEAIYAGDVPSVDVTGARAAGLWAVLVDPDAMYPEIRGVWRVSSVAEVVDHLISGRPPPE
jgi:putative hydrolase of the HAD superfamily